jgi:hypothetical protein
MKLLIIYLHNLYTEILLDESQEDEICLKFNNYIIEIPNSSANDIDMNLTPNDFNVDLIYLELKSLNFKALDESSIFEKTFTQKLKLL